MTKEKQGLKALIDSYEKARLENSIIKMDKPYLETERVLIADSTDLMDAIIEHVLNCKDVFVATKDTALAPVLPEGVKARFRRPMQVTEERERVYFLDANGVLRSKKCEVRQQINPDYIKQTTKRGNGATAEDSTMDRMEQASKLVGFGFNIFAVGDEKLRRELMQDLTMIPRPVQRMISQRVRIPYHPEGDERIRIEMAIEPTHVGQTFTGFVWEQPKIDLEIKSGPTIKEARHALLAREQARLMSIFSDLRPQLKSSPTPGFEAIESDLHNPRVRALFEAIAPNQQWWKDDNFGLHLAA